MTERVAIDADLDLVRTLLASGGQDLKLCYQCAACTVVCPVTPDGGPFPRKEMIYGQWGQKDKLILSLDSWLCIQCNDCSTACPRGAKPGDVMAAVRSMSVQAYSVPAFIARAAATPSLLWLLFAIPALILATAIVGMHAGSGFDFLEGRIVFGKMMPVAAIDAIFVPAIVFAGATSLLGLRRFLAAMRREYPRAQNGEPLRAAVLGTVKDILSHRFFRQCETNQVGFGAHVAVMYGFIGLSITTTVVGVLYYLNKFQMEVAVSPYDTLHPVKILGNVSGLMAFLGCAAMVTHRMTRSTAGKASFFDWTFLWVLFLTVITGFLCQLFRVFATALLAYSTYYIHLILVFFLLAYLPYTKFAHIFFRTAAMIFARWSGRDLPRDLMS